MMLHLVWIAVAVFVVDQATKFAIVRYLTQAGELVLAPFFNLVLVHNTGAAFGFLHEAGGWQNVFFIAIAIVVSAAILVVTYRLRPRDLHIAVALMLVLGGALGNLLDRLRLGYVVDFLDVHYAAWHWPAFNVADAAITVGAVLLVMDAIGLRFRRRDPA
jgi:signal peptidase II